MSPSRGLNVDQLSQPVSAGVSDRCATLERAKIFLSSVIAGYEDYRVAAASGATVLGHEVIRAEGFPASPQTPQQACLEGVRLADAVVLLLGDRYGAVQASGRSATHEEFVEASGSKPLFVFHQSGVSRDEDMARFVDEVHAWDSGRLSGQFRTPDELRDAVTKAPVSLGKWGAARLGQVLGGAGMKPSSPFRTTMGNRYVDRLINGVADEAKAGVNVGLTSSIRRQVLKDAELLATGQLRGAQWHFFQGAQDDLLMFLKDNGIGYTVHP